MDVKWRLAPLSTIHENLAFKPSTVDGFASLMSVFMFFSKSVNSTGGTQVPWQHTVLWTAWFAVHAATPGCDGTPFRSFLALIEGKLAAEDRGRPGDAIFFLRGAGSCR